MTAFTTYAANSRTSLMAHHGESATHTTGAGVATSVTGVWEDGGGRDGMGATVEEQERRRLAKRMGVWTMKTSDIASVVIDTDTITRGGYTYVIKAVTTEGGLHRCECVQKETLSVAQRDRKF